MYKYYETSVPDILIRSAEPEDAPLLFSFIQTLAAYQKMTDQVSASENDLRENIFLKKQAEAIIAEYKGTPIGFALYFSTFSTFRGKANLFLEDLFVKEEYRGIGAGKALLSCVGRIALEQGCERLEWFCLDWNKASIRFYLRMGAKALDDRRAYRTEGDALIELASKI